MQKIYNVDKWTTIQEGKALSFPSEKNRFVRIETNSRNKVALFILDGEGKKPRFLALVEGRDTVEFQAPGKFSLAVEGGDCAIYTIDGALLHHVNVAPEIFTKIAERRTRNPEFEYMMAHVQANMQRRLQQQADELQQQYERREAAREAARKAELRAEIERLASESARTAVEVEQTGPVGTGAGGGAAPPRGAARKPA